LNHQVSGLIDPDLEEFPACHSTRNRLPALNIDVARQRIPAGVGGPSLLPLGSAGRHTRPPTHRPRSHTAVRKGL